MNQHHHNTTTMFDSRSLKCCLGLTYQDRHFAKEIPVWSHHCLEDFSQRIGDQEDLHTYVHYRAYSRARDEKLKDSSFPFHRLWRQSPDFWFPALFFHDFSTCIKRRWERRQTGDDGRPGTKPFVWCVFLCYHCKWEISYICLIAQGLSPFFLSCWLPE